MSCCASPVPAPYCSPQALPHSRRPPSHAGQSLVPGCTLPEPSEEVLGAAVNGKLYGFSGLGPGFRPRALVYEYDPASNAWAKKKPMRLNSHHVAFVGLNNKIYAFGGFVLPEAGPPAWNPIDNAWEYDPATDEWKALAPLPTKRGAAAAAVANGKIYVTGGANSIAGVTENGIHPTRPHNVLTTVEEYDPATNTWRSVRSMLVRTQSPCDRKRRRQALYDRRPYRVGLHHRRRQQYRPRRDVRSGHQSVDRA